MENSNDRKVNHNKIMIDLYQNQLNSLKIDQIAGKFNAISCEQSVLENSCEKLIKFCQIDQSSSKID